ncbi:hypothetical protein AB0876_10965 [Mycobacterium sp. NPDC049093]
MGPTLAPFAAEPAEPLQESGMSANIQHIVRDATVDSMLARIRPYAVGNRCDTRRRD